MEQEKLKARIADLDEKAEWQKMEMHDWFQQVRRSLEPRNIARNAAVGLFSKIRSLFTFKKKTAKS